MMWLEQAMYQVSGWFMAPVLLMILVLSLYSVYALGQCTGHWWQRRRHREMFQAAREQALTEAGRSGSSLPLVIPGYHIFSTARNQPHTSDDALNVLALRHLQWLRITTKIAPMLGLVATMIPMAPALKALGAGDIQGISENLVVAFSAVIFGLMIASITFWLLSVKKAWLAEELVAVGTARAVPLKRAVVQPTKGSAAEQELDHEAA